MKDVDLKKECEIENFDYGSCWDEGEDKDVKEIVEEFSRGVPRTGLTGKYLRPKNHVGRKQLKRSWNNGLIKDDS